MPGIRQQYRDLIAVHGVTAREADSYDSIEIGPANMYRLASNGRGPKLSLTEASFTGAVLYLAGHRDTAALAGHHAMLHETLHTCGPTPDTMLEGAVTVEELITELAAREVLWRTLSIPHDASPLIAGSAGCYQDLIEAAAAEVGGDRGLAITALAASALQVKSEMGGKRGPYQVLGVLLTLAECSDGAARERIMSTFACHWTSKVC